MQAVRTAVPSRRSKPCRELPSPADQLEASIQRAGSIGELERLAGIEQDPEARYGFWQDYMRLPPAKSLDAGVAELKRRIRHRGSL